MKNHSHHLILFALLFLGITQANAQDCLYEINKENKFDNRAERLTEAIVIARKVQRDGALPLRKVMAQLRQLGEHRYFVLKFPVTMVMSPTFTDNSKNSELTLLLENKTKIVLPLAELMKNVQDKVEFRYATDFILTEKDIAVLKKHRITDIRVGMRNNTFDMELEDGAAEMLQEAMSCVE